VTGGLARAHEANSGEWERCVRAATATIFLTLSVMSAVGCTSTRLPVMPVTLPEHPLVERLPLAVGLSITPQFRSYEHIEEWTGPVRHPWRLLLGPASTSVFQQALSAMFDHVEPLAVEPSSAVGLDQLDAILEPTIEDAHLSFTADLKTARFRIRYRVTLRTVSGQAIASWTAFGAAEDEQSMLELRPTVVARIVMRALRAAAAEILVGLHRQPDLMRWLVDSKRVSPTGEAPRTASLPAGAPPPSREGATFVGVEEDEGGPFLECLATRVRDDQPGLRIVPTSVFRDGLFPWFEPRTAPGDAEGFAGVLARSDVAERLAALDVRYVVLVSGRTTMNWKGEIGCGVAYQGGGCLGLKWADRKTKVAAVVWDSERATEVKLDAEANAKWIIPALVIPIPLIAPTESVACAEAAKQIEDYMQRAGSEER